MMKKFTRSTGWMTRKTLLLFLAASIFFVGTPRFPFVRASSSKSGSKTADCRDDDLRTCSSDEECEVSASLLGMPIGCGKASCKKGTCKYKEKKKYCANTYVNCEKNDSMCTKGPNGMCATDECVYYWCLEEEKENSDRAELISATEVIQEITGNLARQMTVAAPCCNSNADCVDANPKSSSMDECGNVACNTTSNLCEFNAWESGGNCRQDYYVWCAADGANGQHGMCDRGPEGSVGLCNGYKNSECSYYWCPLGSGGTTSIPPTTTIAAPTTTAALTTTAQLTTATAPPVTTTAPLVTTAAQPTTTASTRCCTTAADCAVDIPEKPSMGKCGNLICNYMMNRCEFVAWNSSDFCKAHYYESCAGQDGNCIRGPAGSVGLCNDYNNSQCSYSWCPSGAATTTALPATTTAPPTTTTAPPAATTVPTGGLPTECSKPCTSVDDCIDPNGGSVGTFPDPDPSVWPNSLCGSVGCSNGFCSLVAWQDVPECNYVRCNENGAPNDALCSSAHFDLTEVEGTCSNNNIECVYKWCPFDPDSVPEPVAFSSWAQSALIGGAGVYATMTDQELDQILDDFVVQGVTVVEGDADLSSYLSDAQFDAQIDLMRKVADKAHQRGLQIVWYYPALEVITPNGEFIPDSTVLKDHPDWVQYGIDGVANVFYGGAGQVFWVDPGAESAWMSPSSPGYRNYFIERIQRIVKHGGIDGLWLDVPIYADFGPTPWSDRNPAAAERFLLDTGFVAPLVKDWNDPAWRRWITWRHEELARFLQDVTTAARVIDPEFVMIAETLPTDYNGGTVYGLDGGSLKNVAGLTHVWEVDTMSNTIGMRNAREDDWISFISAMKYTRAASGKKPSWVFSYGIEGGNSDAEQVMAQAMIAGNNPYELKVPEMTTTVGGDFRTRMFGWAKAYGPYLFEAKSLATVGVYFSSASRDYVDQFSGLGMFVNTNGQGDPLWWASSPVDSAFNRDYLGEFRGMIELLVNEHIPFNTLVVPDEEELSAYDTVILPNVQAMSQGEADLLRQFVSNGGHLVVTGPNPSGLDEYGNSLQEFILSDVLGINKAVSLPSEKENAFGSGSSHFFSEQIGKTYFTKAFGLSSRADAGQKLSSTIRASSTVLVETNADRRVHVELSRLQDEMVLQFTNFIGLNGAFSVVPTTFTVTLTVPSAVERVEVTSPDKPNPDRAPIQFSTTGQKISFQLDLVQYSMVVVSFFGATNAVVNHAPAPGHDYFQTLVSTPVTFSNTQLLSNDGDLDGDAVSVVSVRKTSRTKGTLATQGGGTYVYTPRAGFTGIDSLVYEISDSAGETSIGRVNIVVEAASQKSFPLSVVPLQGQYLYGALNGLVSADTETYGIISSQDSGVVDWYSNTSISEAVGNIEAIEVLYNGHYSEPGLVSQEIFLYNFANSKWELLDSSWLGNYDIPVLVSIESNLAAYISSSGEARARVKGVISQAVTLSCFANSLDWKIILKV